MPSRLSFLLLSAALSSISLTSSHAVTASSRDARRFTLSDPDGRIRAVRYPNPPIKA